MAYLSDAPVVLAELARIGGDEFALLLPATDLTAARTALDRLRADVERRELGVSLSVGIGQLDTAAPDAQSLCESADAAMYAARRSGGNTVVGSDDVHASGVTTTTRTRALHLLLGGEIDVAHQPIVGLDDGVILGYEALARPRELHGLSGPAEAFAVAERVGLAGDPDARCRATALQQAALLPDGGLLFLNVSPAALGHPSLESDPLLAAVAAAGRTPAGIVLEMTERSVVTPEVLRRETTRLRGIGFTLALDGVGAGNTGRGMLRAVRVDIVKVDRSVVAAAPTEAGDRAVLCAVVAYAAATGTTVIAEGIETAAMLEHVRHLPDDPAMRGRVQAVQGHLIGRPETVTPSSHRHGGGIGSILTR